MNWARTRDNREVDISCLEIIEHTMFEDCAICVQFSQSRTCTGSSITPHAEFTDNCRLYTTPDTTIHLPLTNACSVIQIKSSIIPKKLFNWHGMLLWAKTRKGRFSSCTATRKDTCCWGCTLPTTPRTRSTTVWMLETLLNKFWLQSTNLD